jgi:hypothetical protein
MNRYFLVTMGLMLVNGLLSPVMFNVISPRLSLALWLVLWPLAIYFSFERGSLERVSNT